MSQHLQDRKGPSLADLEAFERLLRHSLQETGKSVPPPAMSAPVAPAVPKSASSALAELARIVNDPAPFGAPPQFKPLPKHESFLQTEVKAELGANWPGQPAPPPVPSIEDEFSRMRAASPSADVDPLFAFEEELRRFDEARGLAGGASAAPDLRADYPGEAEPSYVTPQPPPVQAPVRQWQHQIPQNVSISNPPPAPEPVYAPEPSGLDEAEARLAEEAALAANSANDLQPDRSKRIFLALGGVALAGLVAIGGIFAFSGGKKANTAGNVPVISASKTPTKEKPTDPGGVDVPDQNKGILAPKVATESRPAQVVNNTEQPMDLNQVARQAPVRVITPSPYQQPQTGDAAPATGPNGNPLEPRRVTSVRIPTGESAAAPAAASSTSAVPAIGAGAAAVAAARPAAAAPVVPPTTPAPRATTPAPEAPKVAPEAPKAQTRPPAAAASAPRPAAAPPAANAPMALTPSATQRTASTNAAPSRPAAAPASTGGGGYAIQLASRPTQADATSASAQLRTKYASAIGSRSPSVVSGEANGKTVYRVRVGGYSQADATSACEKVKAAGGGCFVTRQ